jgi:hypothetical protein
MFINKSQKHVNMCQNQSVPRLAETVITITETFSIKKRFRLLMKRWFSLRIKMRIKASISKLITWFSKPDEEKEKLLAQISNNTSLNLKAGDWVRVRSKEEIDVTLDHWGELRGCSFLGEMYLYCGTRHQVLKPVERFVDERDSRVKKGRGVVLLEGVICEGTELYGRCDRSCFYFWRTEWLEKVEKSLED